MSHFESLHIYLLHLIFNKKKIIFMLLDQIPLHYMYIVTGVNKIYNKRYAIFINVF